jgi:hypothetical protein
MDTHVGGVFRVSQLTPRARCAARIFPRLIPDSLARSFINSLHHAIQLHHRAGMNWRQAFITHFNHLMTVNHINISSLSRFPPETYSPLIVHTNTVLAFTISRKLFQTIPRRCSQILNQTNTIYQIQLAPGLAPVFANEAAVATEVVGRSDEMDPPAFLFRHRGTTLNSSLYE